MCELLRGIVRSWLLLTPSWRQSFFNLCLLEQRLSSFFHGTSQHGVVICITCIPCCTYRTVSILFAHTLDAKTRYVHQGENVTKRNSSRTRLPILLSGVATATLLLSGCTGNGSEENDAAAEQTTLLFRPARAVDPEMVPTTPAPCSRNERRSSPPIRLPI